METTDLKISEQTQMFIECIDSLNSQWELVNKALVVFYGVQQAQQVMREEYNDAFDELKEVVQRFLVLSIDEKMSNLDFKEI